MHVSFAYFKLLQSLKVEVYSPGLSCKAVLLTRGNTSGNEVSPCMRYIVLPPAVLTRLLDFWVSAWLTLIRPSASGASPNLAID